MGCTGLQGGLAFERPPSLRSLPPLPSPLTAGGDGGRRRLGALLLPLRRQTPLALGELPCPRRCRRASQHETGVDRMEREMFFCLWGFVSLLGGALQC